MARRVIRRLKSRVTELIAGLKAWTVWIWSRAMQEPGYAEAVADLLVALGDLVVRDHLRRRVIRELARLLATALRGFRGDHGPGGFGGPWTPPDDPDDPGWNWA